MHERLKCKCAVERVNALRGCREGVGWGTAEGGSRLLQTCLQAPGLNRRGKTAL